MREAFIAIDVQNDFCPGGALAVADGDAVVPIINGLLPHFELCVFTQDWHPAAHHSFASSHKGKHPFDNITLDYGDQTLWPDHCVQGSFGAEFHKDLSLHKAHLILRKGHRQAIDSYSAFLENDRRTDTGLRGYLQGLGVKRIILAGLATDFCVKFSALDGRANGFEVIVAEDACRAIDLDGSLAQAMDQMTAADVQFVKSTAL